MKLWIWAGIAAALAALGFAGHTLLGYANGRPIEFKGKEIAPGKWMRADAADAFKAMAQAAAAVGVTLIVNSAFRTWEEQMELYTAFMNGERAAVAAEPGFSQHQNGIAIDLETGGGTNAAYRWLAANAANFGFRRTVPSEAWHFQYMG